MNRWLAASMATTAAITIGSGMCATAQAEPPVDRTGGSCAWEPIAPTVVDVSDVKMVTGAVKQGACTMQANPSGTTACLAIKSEDTAGTCAETMTSNPAQAYYKYIPGATYVLTGKGCANIFVPPFKLCQTIGPLYYTL